MIQYSGNSCSIFTMGDSTTVIAFDLYGTLLSTASVAEELTKMYGEEKAKTIAAQARRYQLEYTWRINSMGKSRLAGGAA